MKTPPDIMSVADAAKLLKVGPRQIRKLIANGTLPARKIGDSYIITRNDLAAVPKIRKPGPKPRPAK